MKTSSRMFILFVIGILMGNHSLSSQEAAQLSWQELTQRTVHRRALDAVIWGQPIVSSTRCGKPIYVTPRRSIRVILK
jgi:hypothetical protein